MAIDAPPEVKAPLQDSELEYVPDSQVGPELEVTRVECFADLQDVKGSRKANGADYMVTWEIPLDAMSALAESGDGHDVTFKKVGVGEGAMIHRFGITRDADANKRAKIVVRLAKSEMRKSAGKLMNLIGDDDTHGLLVFEPMQQSLGLTTRAN